MQLNKKVDMNCSHLKFIARLMLFDRKILQKKTNFKNKSPRISIPHFCVQTLMFTPLT
jgi:hypothetical protein